MVLKMGLLFSALLLWILGLLLAGWLISRTVDPEPAAPKPAPDPIVKTVDKWMHDWDRGRA